MKKKVGLGLRHSFHQQVLEQKPKVPWFEVITENYLYFDGAPRKFLQQIRQDYPVVFHGVSLSIGSLGENRPNYLQHLKNLIQEFQPAWVSDHLCWTFNGAENSHDLLPLPFTQESLKRVILKTQKVQDFLGQKIYLENPSAYVDFSNNELSEQDFIKELCEKSGCGLLLDLNNLIVNQYNLGYDPTQYLETIKNCDVKQIHLAGHTVKQQVRIDTHDSDISQEVLDLLPYAKNLWPNANPMIEWDDKIPPFDYLQEQRLKIEKLWHGGKPLPLKSDSPTQSNLKARPNQEAHHQFWNLLKTEDFLTQEVVDSANLLDISRPTPAHIGMNVYSSAYYNRIIEVLGKNFPTLKVLLSDYFEEVVMAYIKAYPSIYDSIDFTGTHLSHFLLQADLAIDYGVDPRILSDVAAYEYLQNLSSVAISQKSPSADFKSFTEEDWFNVKIKLRSNVFLHQAQYDVSVVVDAIKENRSPEIPDEQLTHYLFFRDISHHHFVALKELEYKVLCLFSNFKPILAGLEVVDQDIEEYIKILIRFDFLFELEIQP
jgi:uncharacterized protein (UPF0276 family)